MFEGFLSGLILFGSVAFRTPNDVSIKQDDYEISLGFKKLPLHNKALT